MNPPFFLYSLEEKGDPCPIRRRDREASVSHKAKPFRINYPGKNGQKIGIMITLAMKVIMQSGTPTFT
jgi:hypothetical protein